MGVSLSAYALSDTPHYCRAYASVGAASPPQKHFLLCHAARKMRNLAQKEIILEELSPSKPPNYHDE